MPLRAAPAPILLLLALTGSASVQAQGSIYTCVDAKGRRLTSDRPIAECLDREQKELNSTGSVKRVVKPVPTAEEAERLEAERRRQLEEQSRVADERRRDRALLSRYPRRDLHDASRADALRQVDEVIAAAAKRIDELRIQRKDLDRELEFYKGDVSKATPRLKRALEENEASVAAQQRFIAAQNEEKKRIHTRFDEELERLKRLWAAEAASPAVARRAASGASAAR